jgi:hypothetical protein
MIALRSLESSTINHNWDSSCTCTDRHIQLGTPTYSAGKISRNFFFQKNLAKFSSNTPWPRNTPQRTPLSGIHHETHHGTHHRIHHGIHRILRTKTKLHRRVRTEEYAVEHRATLPWALLDYIAVLGRKTHCDAWLLAPKPTLTCKTHCDAWLLAPKPTIKHTATRDFSPRSLRQNTLRRVTSRPEAYDHKHL